MAKFCDKQAFKHEELLADSKEARRAAARYAPVTISEPEPEPGPEPDHGPGSGSDNGDSADDDAKEGDQFRALESVVRGRR